MVFTVGSTAILKKYKSLNCIRWTAIIGTEWKILSGFLYITSRIYLLVLSTVLDIILVGEKHVERTLTFRSVRPKNRSVPHFLSPVPLSVQQHKIQHACY